MNRLLSINTNAPGLMSAAGALWAIAAMIWHATHHQGVIDPQVIISGVAALAAFFTRQVVTPVADPKDLNGKPLVPAPAAAAAAKDPA